MRSAKHIHIIARRTLLAAIASGTSVGITASATVAAASPFGGNGLPSLWCQRCQAQRAWLDYEGRDPDHEQRLYEAWATLDEQIMATPAVTLEDLQAKFALQRDWLHVAEGEVVSYSDEQDQADDSKLGPDGFLALSIITDIERMFQGEMGTPL